MTHAEVVQLVGTYGQIYVIVIFLIAAAYALWPRNKAKFDRAARIPLDDDRPRAPSPDRAGDRP
ncbi:MAG: cbb3-type cytochrome c oxidase subunit 3 [Alphaproteobacteria bacterium]